MTSPLSPDREVSPSLAIVERVANCEEVDPMELTPLYEAIDPDALDALVRTTEQRGTSLKIEFTYHGYDVTVTGEGVIHLDEHAPSLRMGL